MVKSLLFVLLLASTTLVSLAGAARRSAAPRHISHGHASFRGSSERKRPTTTSSIRHEKDGAIIDSKSKKKKFLPQWVLRLFSLPLRTLRKAIVSCRNKALVWSLLRSCHTGTICYQHLKGEPNDGEAKQILERLEKEFNPIIKRRGYDVRMVGEFTDDRDVCAETYTELPLDNVKKVDEDSELHGYNVICKAVVWGNITPSLIGLRLRTINNNNMFQFYAYSEICEVMCHELAHCIHKDHDAAFYKLMREIQREHALVAQRMPRQRGNKPNKTTSPIRRNPSKGRRLGDGRRV